MSDQSADRKDRTRDRGPMLGTLRQKKKAKPETTTVRKEKKTLVRVVKAKPATGERTSPADSGEGSSRSASKAAETSTPGSLPGPGPKAKESLPPETFECPECGAHLPQHIEMCPICHIKYLRDICPEALDELDRAMSEAAEDYGDLIEIKELDSLPVLHFDAVDGMMNYLEEDGEESEFMMECPHCSAVVQLDVDRCPVCGAVLEPSDIGILSLLRDMDFSSEELSELECPQCGEHVRLENGVCPLCGAVISDPEGSGDDNKLIPIIGNENVVFVHIDLEKGNLNFMQRHLGKITSDQVSIQFEQPDDGNHAHGSNGLSRV